MMENNNSSFVLEYFVGEIMGTRWKPSPLFSVRTMSQPLLFRRKSFHDREQVRKGGLDLL